MNIWVFIFMVLTFCNLLTYLIHNLRQLLVPLHLSCLLNLSDEVMQVHLGFNFELKKLKLNNMNTFFTKD